MNPRAFLALSLLSASPSLLFAQPYPEPKAPAVAPAPKAPRAALAPLPASAPAPAIPAAVEAPPLPPAAEMPQTPKVAPAPVPAAPAAAPAAPAPPRPMGQMINVRIDVTLTDSKGAPKVLTMTVADGESGMNRTTSSISSGSNMGDFSFNADAAPIVVGSKIRLRLTADAVVPIETESTTPNRASKLGLRQSQTVILNDGDSVEIARAADPVSDRAFALSVKVKIQR